MNTNIHGSGDHEWHGFWIGERTRLACTFRRLAETPLYCSNVSLVRKSPRSRGRDRQHAGRVRSPKEKAPGGFTPPGADFSGGLSNLSVSSRRASRRLLRRRFSYSSAPSL